MFNYIYFYSSIRWNFEISGGTALKMDVFQPPKRLIYRRQGGSKLSTNTSTMIVNLKKILFARSRSQMMMNILILLSSMFVSLFSLYRGLDT